MVKKTFLFFIALLFIASPIYASLSTISHGSSGGNLAANDDRYVNVTGDTMTGTLTIEGNETLSAINYTSPGLAGGIGIAQQITIANNPGGDGEGTLIGQLTTSTSISAVDTSIFANAVIFDSAVIPGSDLSTNKNKGAYQVMLKDTGGSAEVSGLQMTVENNTNPATSIKGIGIDLTASAPGINSLYGMRIRKYGSVEGTAAIRGEGSWEAGIDFSLASTTLETGIRFGSSVSTALNVGAGKIISDIGDIVLTPAGGSRISVEGDAVINGSLKVTGMVRDFLQIEPLADCPVSSATPEGTIWYDDSVGGVLRCWDGSVWQAFW